MKITESINLPCGVKIPNRIAKSAMSESMAGNGHIPGIEFYNAYKTWAEGGVGLSISGNVMVDINHLGETHNVVIEKNVNNHDQLKKWATAGQNTKNHIWLQLNHPGKQTPKFITKNPVAPSAIPLAAPLNKAFNTPRELTRDEIIDIIERFGFAAKITKECGFQGVQIHAAHGYLISQFLSPHHNQRSDEWGGSIENRMKFVIEIYNSIRKNVGDDFPIGIKLNSADFSKGGFTHEEAITVTKSLSELGIDLIEISGGTYEKPIMMGTVKETTITREAYFLDYAKDIKAVIKCPLMVTGGFRTGEFMEEALQNNELDIVGLGRSLVIDPNFPNKIFNGEKISSQVHPLTSGFKVIDNLIPLEIIWYTMQIKRMGNKKKVNPQAGVYPVIFNAVRETGIEILKKVRVK